MNDKDMGQDSAAQQDEINQLHARLGFMVDAMLGVSKNALQEIRNRILQKGDAPELLGDWPDKLLAIIDNHLSDTSHTSPREMPGRPSPTTSTPARSGGSADNGDKE